MTTRFDYFIILADMRTGSNFLESNLNAVANLTCFGEAFNPHFIGYPNRSDLLGLDQAARDADPVALINAIAGQPGLGGFRFFNDHDPRALDHALDDPRCAKIILTRNLLDSYVSLKIAQTTGQWKLTNIKRRKQALATFDRTEFLAHLDRARAYHQMVHNRLQVGGQVPFHLSYEDLQDLDVLNGLLTWLDCPERLVALQEDLKPQNPGPVTGKISNPEEMRAALSDLDPFDLGGVPGFEPQRGAAVPTQVACAATPLIWLPVPGGPDAPVRNWLAALDGVGQADLITGMTQKQMRQWKRRHKGSRSFAVLRHPAARAHAVFCDRILRPGSGNSARIRETIRKRFGVPLPRDGPGDRYQVADHRAGFVGFLEFLRLNLNGQTPIRVDAAWASQSQILAGFAGFMPPDHILREDELPGFLPGLARAVGHAAPAVFEGGDLDAPFALKEIYDTQIEDLITGLYQRDYMMFGFEAWRPG